MRHSPCSRLSSAEAASQSVESRRASAFSHRASFFARLSAHSWLRRLRCSCHRVKKWSQGLRKRSHTLCDTARGTGPISFHSAWSLRSSSAVFSQSEDSAKPAAFSHRASFLFRLPASSSACFAKKASVRDLTWSRAALKRVHRASAWSFGASFACFQRASSSRSVFAAFSRSSSARRASAFAHSSSCTLVLTQRFHSASSRSCCRRG